MGNTQSSGQFPRLDSAIASLKKRDAELNTQRNNLNTEIQNANLRQIALRDYVKQLQKTNDGLNNTANVFRQWFITQPIDINSETPVEDPSVGRSLDEWAEGLKRSDSIGSDLDEIRRLSIDIADLEHTKGEDFIPTESRTTSTPVASSSSRASSSVVSSSSSSSSSFGVSASEPFGSAYSDINVPVFTDDDQTRSQDILRAARESVRERIEELKEQLNSSKESLALKLGFRGSNNSASDDFSGEEQSLSGGFPHEVQTPDDLLEYWRRFSFEKEANKSELRYSTALLREYPKLLDVYNEQLGSINEQKESVSGYVSLLSGYRVDIENTLEEQGQLADEIKKVKDAIELLDASTNVEGMDGALADGISNIKQVLVAHENDFRELNAKHEETRRKVEDTLISISTIEQQLRNFISVVDDLAERQVALQSLIEYTEKQLSRAENKRSIRSREGEQSEIRIISERARSQSNTERIDSTLKRARAREASTTREISGTESELDTLRNQTKRLRAQLDEFKASKRFDDIAKGREYDILRTMVGTIDESMFTEDSTLRHKVRDQIRDAYDAISPSTVAGKAQQARLNELNDFVERIEENMSAIRTAEIEKVQFEEQVERLQEHIDEQTGLIDQLNAELEGLRQQLGDASSRATSEAENKEELETLTRKISEHEHTIERMRELAAADAETLTSLTSELASSGDNVRALERSVDELNQQLTETTQQARNDIDKLNSQIQDQNSTLEAKQQRIAELEAQIKVSDDEEIEEEVTNSLRRQIASLEGEVFEVSSKLNTLRTEKDLQLEAQQTKLKSQENALERTQRQLERAKKTIKTYVGLAKTNEEIATKLRKSESAHKDAETALNGARTILSRQANEIKQLKSKQSSEKDLDELIESHLQTQKEEYDKEIETLKRVNKENMDELLQQTQRLQASQLELREQLEQRVEENAITESNLAGEKALNEQLSSDLIDARSAYETDLSDLRAKRQNDADTFERVKNENTATIQTIEALLKANETSRKELIQTHASEISRFNTARDEIVKLTQEDYESEVIQITKNLVEVQQELKQVRSTYELATQTNRTLDTALAELREGHDRDVSRLDARIKDLTAQLASNKADYTRQKDQDDETRRRLQQEIIEKNTAHEASILDLENKKTAIEQSLNESREFSKELENQRDSAEREYRKREEDSKSFNVRLNQIIVQVLGNDFDSNGASAEELSQEGIVAKFENLQRILQDKNQEISRNQEEAEKRSNDERVRLADKIREIEQEKQSTDSQLREANSRLRDLDGVQKALEDLHLENDKRVEIVNALTSNQAKLERVLKERETRINQLETEESKAKERQTELLAQIAKLEANLSAERVRHGNEIEKLTAEHGEALERIRVITEEVEELRRTRDLHIAELKRLEDARSLEQDNVKDTRERIDALEKDRDATQSQLSETEKRLKESQAEQHQLEETNRKLESSLSDEKARIADAFERASKKDARLKSLTDQIRELQTASDSGRKKLEAEIASLRVRMQETSENFKEITDEGMETDERYQALIREEKKRINRDEENLEALKKRKYRAEVRANKRKGGKERSNTFYTNHPEYAIAANAQTDSSLPVYLFNIEDEQSIYRRILSDLDITDNRRVFNYVEAYAINSGVFSREAMVVFDAFHTFVNLVEGNTGQQADAFWTSEQKGTKALIADIIEAGTVDTAAVPVMDVHDFPQLRSTLETTLTRIINDRFLTDENSPLPQNTVMPYTRRTGDNPMTAVYDGSTPLAYARQVDVERRPLFNSQYSYLNDDYDFEDTVEGLVLPSLGKQNNNVVFSVTKPTSSDPWTTMAKGSLKNDVVKALANNILQHLHAGNEGGRVIRRPTTLSVRKILDKIKTERVVAEMAYSSARYIDPNERIKGVLSSVVNKTFYSAFILALANLNIPFDFTNSTFYGAVKSPDFAELVANRYLLIKTKSRKGAIKESSRLAGIISNQLDDFQKRIKTIPSTRIPIFESVYNSEVANQSLVQFSADQKRRLKDNDRLRQTSDSTKRLKGLRLFF